MLSSQPAPYSDDELAAIAQQLHAKRRCRAQSRAGDVETDCGGCDEWKIGAMFDAIVTGVTPRGTFVRVLQPHIEGLLVQAQGVDVGDRLRVKLIRTDVQRGYIDFARA